MTKCRRKVWVQRAGAHVHPACDISEAVVTGKISNLTVGEGTVIGKAYFMLHGEVQVEKDVCINDGVEILTASHSLQHSDWRQFSRPVIIEDYAWIGTGATLLPGVTIGRGEVVGAKSVVRQTVPSGAIVVGNPGQVLEKKNGATGLFAK